LVKRYLGVDRRRSLPRFGPSLYRWCASRSSASTEARPGPVVVLMADCFTTWSEPHVGRAAVRVLEQLGYRVVLPRTGCCGRPLISQGMLAEARSMCSATAAQLEQVVQTHDAVALVGCEPSCVSAIRDDWLELDMPVELPRLRALADRTLLVEQFVESSWDRHPSSPEAHPVNAGPPVILHGHCHQKALWGVESSADLLTRLVGSRLRVLDSGCCGMAGAFGFTTDHYDLSMAIGDGDLLASVRAEPDAIVAAPGTSCRHQIVDGTGRRAVHPIEIAEDSLARPCRPE
jgi:Fe-S oxidoreductase